MPTVKFGGKGLMISSCFPSLDQLVEMMERCFKQWNAFRFVATRLTIIDDYRYYGLNGQTNSNFVYSV